MAVEIPKTLCGGRKTENLIESTCFYLKISRVHVFNLKISRVNVFCLNFSRSCMFCDDNHSKLVPESTRPRGFSDLNDCRQPAQKSQKWRFTFRTKGIYFHYRFYSWRVKWYMWYIYWNKQQTPYNFTYLLIEFLYRIFFSTGHKTNRNIFPGTI